MGSRARIEPMKRLFRNLFSTVRDYAVHYSVPLWRKRRTILKFGGIALLVLFVGLTLTAKLSGNSLARDLQTSRTQLQQLQDRLTNILSPEKIELGQQDLSVDYLIEQINPKTAPVTSISTPSRTLVTLNLLPRISYDYSAFSGVRALRKDTAELLRYHHAVISAMQPILEYNPRAEFADKTLNDQEVKLRIDNARNGLKNAGNELRAASSKNYSDPEKGQLIRSVNQLSEQLETFAQSKDYEQWYKAVEAEQETITKNRQAFWAKETEPFYNRIAELNMAFAEMEKSLQR